MQTEIIPLYMDICIFNFKVRPQFLRSPMLNIVNASRAVSSFSTPFWEAGGAERIWGGGVEGVCVWGGGQLLTHKEQEVVFVLLHCPPFSPWPLLPSSILFIFSSTWQVNLDQFHLPSMTETNILAPRNRALRDRRAVPWAPGSERSERGWGGATIWKTFTGRHLLDRWTTLL